MFMSVCAMKDVSFYTSVLCKISGRLKGSSAQCKMEKASPLISDTFTFISNPYLKKTNFYSIPLIFTKSVGLLTSSLDTYSSWLLMGGNILPSRSMFQVVSILIALCLNFCTFICLYLSNIFW